MKKFRKPSALLLSVVFFVSLCSLDLSGWASGFTDLHDQQINPVVGTIEFQIKILKDISSDPQSHALLLGVAADRSEFFSMDIIEDKIYLRRFFAGCALMAWGSSYHFKVGETHSIKFSWNHASMKFYIDNLEMKREALISSDDANFAIPEIRIGRESNFEISGFMSTKQSMISENREDTAFIQNIKCPNLAQLLREPAQEQYRDMALRNFPDQASRNTVKTYIDLLPARFAAAIKNVVYVDAEHSSGRGEGGLADWATQSEFIEAKYFSMPTVFFHEAAHLLDYKLKINFGVPEARSEWAKISGAHCYYKGGNMDQYGKTFFKNQTENAFLAGQGGQCPSEDLAIWVGETYDHYLKGKSFASSMRPGRSDYSPKVKKKLDFLLSKGFVSQDVYDKVTR